MNGFWWRFWLLVVLAVVVLAFSVAYGWVNLGRQ